MSRRCQVALTLLSNAAGRTLRVFAMPILPLKYQSEAFNELLNEDGLLVMAAGLGIKQILFAFLEMFCDSQSLVLALNLADSDVDWLIEEFSILGIKTLPRVVDAAVSTSER